MNSRRGRPVSRSRGMWCTLRTARVRAVLTSAVALGDGLRHERGELAARHVGAVSRAVAFLLTHSPRRPLRSDALLFHRLLATLLLGKPRSLPALSPLSTTTLPTINIT